MKRSFKKYLSLLLVCVLIAAMTLMTGCKGKEASGNAGNGSASVSTLGSGATQFNFNVVDADAKETNFVINTDEKTVGAALLAVGLIAGDESEYGLYVKTVNGLTVDWDKDGKYWAFYIDGEYAMTGVDATDVNPGSTYTFKVE